MIRIEEKFKTQSTKLKIVVREIAWIQPDGKVCIITGVDLRKIKKKAYKK